MSTPHTNTPPRQRPRKRSGILLRLVVLLVLLVVALLAWFPLLLPHVLQQQGIVLEWQQPRLTLHGLQLKQLHIAQDDLQLELQDVQLDWLWQKYPLQRLEIGRLDAQATLPAESDASENTFNLPALARWLPQQIAIRKIDADIQGMARVQGLIRLQADEEHPLWQPRELELDLSIEQLAPQWLTGIPAELQPERLLIRTLTHPDAASRPGAIQVLALDVHSEGQSQIQLSGILSLMDSPGWHGELEQARLHLQLPQLELDGMPLEQLELQMQFAARVDEQQLELQLEQPASLRIASMRPDAETRMQDIQAEFDRLQLQVQTQNELSIRLGGNYQATIGQLHHPLLHAQTWSASGKLDGHLPELDITAAIGNQHGLQLDSNWDWNLDSGNLSGNIRLQEHFLRAGNPLQKTLTDWPELVEFSNGRISGQAQVRMPADKPQQISGQLKASGLDGIVNRSELGKLEFTAFFRLDGELLRLDIPKLVVGELDPGIPIRQLTLLETSYDGHLDRLDAGTLRWQEASGLLLGGSFKLPASQLRLDRSNLLQLQLQGVQLQEALILYPTEGLQGQAIIDGTLPLQVSPQGVFIEQGHLLARQPGVLQFQSEQIRALGRTNPGMQLVTEALEDFHFNVLSSKLDYEPSGKLLFNIRLEGKNPAVEKGRPIHLNLNLEEDLPALLASIQLSNHVSETIQERIRQRLQNR